MKHLCGLFLCLSMLLIAGCGESEPVAVEEQAPSHIERIIYVAPYTEVCEGVATQECILVRESLADEWEYYYEDIEGFRYEAGYTWKLLIQEQANEEVAADGSSKRWLLLDVLGREGSFETQAGEEEENVQIWFLDYMKTDVIALDTNITLEFRERVISGSGGCNNYQAGYTAADSNVLRIDAINATKQLCAESISQQERDFFDSLATVRTYEQADAGTLLFRDDDGTAVLTFVTSR